MTEVPRGTSGGFPASYLATGSASFLDFVQAQAPEVLASSLRLPASAAPVDGPHSTTIVALVFTGGVVLAGDRRATMGSTIAHREMEKVFAADEYSVVGIAGSAGIAMEVVRLFQLELEHFEKIEGTLLSLDGKANRLATMIRGNLGLAMQGLAVVPLFAGFDLVGAAGRIYSYDVTGGRYEEHEHHSVGSGSVFARGALKKLWRPGLTESEAVGVAVEALTDAADDDSATGGPDTVRRVWPVIMTVTADGVRRVSDDELAGTADRLAQERSAAATEARRFRIGGAAR